MTARLDERATLGEVSDVSERAVSPPPRRRRKSRRTVHVRNGGGRPKIDWAEAFEFYATMGPTRSFRSVSEKFQVSRPAIRKHAVAERWDERVTEIDNRLAAKREAKAERTLEGFQTDAVDLGHVLLEQLRAAVESGVPPKPSDFKGIVQALQLLYGEATSRPAMHEVTQAWSLAHTAAIRTCVLVVIEEYVPKTKRAVAAKAFQLALPPAMNEALEGLAA
jgi:hypothetical protein